MSVTFTVTIRFDKEIKESAEQLFGELGMNLSAAFNIFAGQALRQGKIPFEIFDPFYSEKNRLEPTKKIAEAGTAINR